MPTIIEPPQRPPGLPWAYRVYRCPNCDAEMCFAPEDDALVGNLWEHYGHGGMRLLIDCPACGEAPRSYTVDGKVHVSGLYSTGMAKEQCPPPGIAPDLRSDGC
jgi:hypothetical protein